MSNITNDCPICLEEINISDEYHMSCKHIICNECNTLCIKTALKKNENIIRCPLCRHVSIRIYTEKQYELQPHTDSKTLLHISLIFGIFIMMGLIFVYILY